MRLYVRKKQEIDNGFMLRNMYNFPYINFKKFEEVAVNENNKKIIFTH